MSMDAEKWKALLGEFSRTVLRTTGQRFGMEHTTGVELDAAERAEVEAFVRGHAVAAKSAAPPAARQMTPAEVAAHQGPGARNVALADAELVRRNARRAELGLPPLEG
jgi:hypothetical protein